MDQKETGEHVIIQLARDNYPDNPRAQELFLKQLKYKLTAEERAELDAFSKAGQTDPTPYSPTPPSPEECTNRALAIDRRLIYLTMSDRWRARDYADYIASHAHPNPLYGEDSDYRPWLREQKKLIRGIINDPDSFGEDGVYVGTEDPFNSRGPSMRNVFEGLTREGFELLYQALFGEDDI